MQQRWPWRGRGGQQHWPHPGEKLKGALGYGPEGQTVGCTAQLSSLPSFFRAGATGRGHQRRRGEPKSRSTPKKSIHCRTAGRQSHHRLTLARCRLTYISHHLATLMKGPFSCSFPFLLTIIRPTFSFLSWSKARTIIPRLGTAQHHSTHLILFVFPPIAFTSLLCSPILVAHIYIYISSDGRHRPYHHHYYCFGSLLSSFVVGTPPRLCCCRTPRLSPTLTPSPKECE